MTGLIIARTQRPSSPPPLCFISGTKIGKVGTLTQRLTLRKCKFVTGNRRLKALNREICTKMKILGGRSSGVSRMRPSNDWGLPNLRKHGFKQSTDELSTVFVGVLIQIDHLSILFELLLFRRVVKLGTLCTVGTVARGRSRLAWNCSATVFFYDER